MKVVADQIKPAVEAGKRLYFGHVDALDLLEEFCEMLGVEDPIVSEIGGVVGAHVGPGAYGVAYL
jgi:fatty acid-binding protein DegV